VTLGNARHRRARCFDAVVPAAILGARPADDFWRIRLDNHQISRLATWWYSASFSNVSKSRVLGTRHQHLAILSGGDRLFESTTQRAGRAPPASAYPCVSAVQHDRRVEMEPRMHTDAHGYGPVPPGHGIAVSSSSRLRIRWR
jgi:hypothetical protein